jgi:uncharacterized membrane protein YbaN (DUF454 family)
MPMTKIYKRWTLLITGWAFLLLGIAGLFLPVLQGVLFIGIGLVILSTEYVWAHNLLQKLKTRFPKFGGTLERARERAHRWIHTDEEPAK